MLKFRGCQNFRQRLLFATLSGRALRIDDIRAKDQNPGLRDFEACFLRLLEKVSNGCLVEISETGTTLRYKPGVLTGGSGLSHDCPPSRSIGYYLEPLLLLGLFAKRPLFVTLRGVTNDHVDPGVDTFRTVTLPLLKRLGVEEGLELRIVRRGAAPLGGGEVALRVPVVKNLAPINWTDEGMVSPQTTNRMVDGCRGLLNKLLADVYIFTDAMAGREAGNSPGYGITLVAETTSGCLLSAECAAAAGAQQASSEEPVVVAEDVGRAAAAALLEEVQRGGVVDSSHQALLLTLCALGPAEIAQARLSPLSPQAVLTLRHLKDFFGVQFNVRPEASSRTIFLSCIGAGLRNLSKKVT